MKNLKIGLGIRFYMIIYYQDVNILNCTDGFTTLCANVGETPYP